MLDMLDMLNQEFVYVLLRDDISNHNSTTNIVRVFADKDFANEAVAKLKRDNDLEGGKSWYHVKKIQFVK